jgi:hypothetical protein
MDNLARPTLVIDLGDAFVRTILSDGSCAVTAPLTAFLENGGDRRDLRPHSKTARAALLADIAHFMHISHGRHPGIIGHAAQKIVDDAAQNWLVAAIDGFAAEQSFLNTLTVTAGPIRRLLGQDKVNTLIESQAKNFQMLATSDRKGCPAGAAIAFIVDWHQTRPLLDMVAHEMGLARPSATLPSVSECATLAGQLDDGGSYRRAMAFGAYQTLEQMRGLWRLIAARHSEMLTIQP